MKLPFARTWWIDTGRVLGGCFPGSEAPEQVAVRMAALLDAGVTGVVCLQEAEERGRGGRPFEPYDSLLSSLAQQRGVAMRWIRLPVRDMTPPTRETVRAALQHIAENVGVTYVHCWGGHGRTGVIAGCYLRERGLTTEQALEHMRAARAHDPHLIDQSAPQTLAQVDVIRGWETTTV